VKIELRLYASLRVYMPETNSTTVIVDIGQGTRIRELLEQFKVPANSVKIIFLNGVHAKGDEILKDGDRIGVFPPIAGG
jgi:molybdopterin synthase sulfur carrier subunit